ncbi:hypothetical protein CU098_010551 [Rhizopus stolonifer]|uniref:MAGE domain-containing protein n=1 Tax=Rhizopus stolonifer TaxID=4846 RepID=A0A367K0C3_RHIST|nr:hypothetical protein CU098_010551 [Rhizopus stolonifer]
MSTQKGKRNRMDLDDSYEPEAESSQRVKTMSSSTDWENEETQRKVKDVVRYCLSCEYKRKTIKREDLQKHLNAKGYMYNLVIDKAKTKLRNVFGFDLVELPSIRDKQNQSKTQQQKTQTTDTQTQGRGPSTGAYVLVSSLKEVYSTADIITRTPEEYQYTGILYTILGLIFLNANEISSPELYAHLDRMKIRKHGSDQLEDRDKILDYFIKLNYLRKTKKPDTEGEDLEFIFTAGARAKVELPTASLVHFMCSFYNGSEEEKQALARKMYLQAGFSDSVGR